MAKAVEPGEIVVEEIVKPEVVEALVDAVVEEIAKPEVVEAPVEAVVEEIAKTEVVEAPVEAVVEEIVKPEVVLAGAPVKTKYCRYGWTTCPENGCGQLQRVLSRCCWRFINYLHHVGAGSSESSRLMALVYSQRLPAAELIVLDYQFEVVKSLLGITPMQASIIKKMIEANRLEAAWPPLSAYKAG